VLVDGDDKIDTSDKGRIAVACAKHVGSIMDGIDRRRACGVDGKARALEVKGVTNPITDDARVDTRGRVVVTEVRISD